MRIADYIANRIKELNEHIFMFVGGGAMYLNDAIGRCGIKFVCMHHEQALSMAAEAYARITGRPSVCMVTSGPGGTNAITGLYGAWVDSIPVIFISGQIKQETMRRGNIRQIGDQEINIIDIVQPLTKFAIVCRWPENIPYLIDKAIYEATSGRPGPTWLDIPLDVQNAPYEEIYKDGMHHTQPYKEINEDRVYNIVKLLKESKRPVIIAGSGIRSAGAIETFWRVMDKLRIPAIPSFNARDLGPFRYPAFGMMGNTFSNEIINKADLILILGCRMNIRQIGYDFGKLGKNAIKIMVDIDPEELNKHTFVPDIKVEEDVGDFLTALNSLLDGHVNEWAGTITKGHVISNSDYVNPYNFIEALNNFTEDRDIIVSANGTPSIAAVRSLLIRNNMRLILNSGCAAMGYGLPAAIGAAFASGKRIICFEGDGSIQLNIQELQTLVYHQLPVKIFIFDNDGYNSIKNTQDRYFDGFYVGADARSGISFPDFGEIALAYGIKYFLAYNDKDLDRTIKKTLQTEGPAICELNLDPELMLEKAEI